LFDAAKERNLAKVEALIESGTFIDPKDRVRSKDSKLQ
jgi:hypothetical protein